MRSADRRGERRQRQRPGLEIASSGQGFSRALMKRSSCAAVALEEEIKGWRREKKVALIEGAGRAWGDLVAGLLEVAAPEDKQIARPEGSGSG
jgi:hypothetical protein